MDSAACYTEGSTTSNDDGDTLTHDLQQTAQTSWDWNGDSEALFSGLFHSFYNSRSMSPLTDVATPSCCFSSPCSFTSDDNNAVVVLESDDCKACDALDRKAPIYAPLRPSRACKSLSLSSSTFLSGEALMRPNSLKDYPGRKGSKFLLYLGMCVGRSNGSICSFCVEHYCGNYCDGGLQERNDDGDPLCGV